MYRDLVEQGKFLDAQIKKQRKKEFRQELVRLMVEYQALPKEVIATAKTISDNRILKTIK